MEIDIATLRGWIGRKAQLSVQFWSCDATGARYTQASVTLQASLA
jgi:hypothetical protein